LANPVSDFKKLLRHGEQAFHGGDREEYEKALRLAAKMLRNLATSGQINAALSLEPSWYNALVKKVETERHYHESFQWHGQSFWDAGQKDRRPLEGTGVARRLAFVAHTGSLLGHTEVMLRIIEGWRRSSPHLEPYFISLSGMQPELAKRLKDLAVPRVNAPKDLKPSQVCKWVSNLIAQNAISTAVWLSTPCWVSYAFGVGLAPRQILWSLKFHALHLGSSVIHVGMTKPAEGEIQINEAPWKAFSPPLTLSVRKRPIEDIRALRIRWPGVFLFGTLAREEKFNSPSFVVAVVRVLKSTKGTHFLYTGKQQPVMLAEALQQAGLGDRSTFVGWVDTDLYAQAIDGFLETFPFGCGITGAQAVEHGTPVVSMWDEDTLPRFYFPDLLEARAFSPDWRIATSIDEYVESAVAMIAAGSRHEERVSGKRISSQVNPSLARIDEHKPEQLRDLFGLPAA